MADSTTEVRNISLSIPIPKEGVVLRHRARSPQDLQTRGGEHGYIFVTAHQRWQPAPSSAKESQRKHTLAGNLFFASFEDALASRLGEPEQLLALHLGDPYDSGRVIEVDGISDDDREYLEREWYGAYTYDRELRKLERWRRMQDRRLIWKIALRNGDRRPLELRQQERSLDWELGRIYRAINKLKAKSRKRAEDETLSKQAEALRAELKEVRVAFSAYYVAPPKTPLDEQIAAVSKQFGRSSEEKRAKEDFEPTFTSRRDDLVKEQKAAKQNGNEAALKRIKRQLDALAEEKATAQAHLAELKQRRESVNPRAALEDRVQQLINEAYRRHNYISTGSRQHVREKYTENGLRFLKLRKGAPPRLFSYEGGGSVYVQVQGGVTVQSLLAGTHPQVKLQPGARNPLHAKLTLVTQHRTLELPVYGHRELPPDGVIVGVRVKCVRDASKCRSYRSPWDMRRLSCILTVKSASFVTPIRIPKLTGAIAPSFRKLENGDLRIGIFARSDGYMAEIRMSHEHRAIWMRPLGDKRLGCEWETIPQQRRHRPLKTHEGAVKQHRRGVYASLIYADQKNEGKVKDIGDSDQSSSGAGRNAEFELCRGRLLDFIRTNRRRIPGWLLERCQHLHTFRSKEAMHTIAHLFLVHLDKPTDPFLQTRDNGTKFPLPTRAIQFAERPTLSQVQEMPEHCRDIMQYLWHWTALDRHNHQHESGNRHRALRFRKNEYRRLCLFLMRDCTLIKVQNIDQKRYLSREGGLESVQRMQGRAVAGSELVECLVAAASKLGGRAGYLKPSAEHQWSPTATHYVCGKKASGVLDGLLVRCEHCDMSYDRDENAAMNTLAAPEEWIAQKRKRAPKGGGGDDGGGGGGPTKAKRAPQRGKRAVPAPIAALSV